ncbi:MAG: mechanosensitive ion channel family protein [Chloroflexi bacterium]|nr:mechanosensitive ion channel family protein [Chloroflexota bacterium]
MKRKRFFIWLFCLLVLPSLLVACVELDQSLEEEAQIVATRTPLPEPTPDAIGQQITAFAESSSLADFSFLGLSLDDWLNLGASLLIVLLGYLLGTWLTRYLLRWLVNRTSVEFGRAILDAIGPQLRWLIVTLSLRLATFRLSFLNVTLKRLLYDLYFLLALLLLTIAIWRLLDLGNEQFCKRFDKEGRLQEMNPALVLLTRLGRAFLLVAAGSVLLAHLGVNVAALTAALGIGGLGISLAARDTIADAIAGFIILFDRPFRIGDRIEIQEIDTWGDVTDIGLRTTRIRTRDNRLVIVPNSIIGSNQIINYTYPDPRYRIQIHVSIAYGRDIESIRKLLIDTVRQVEGVLPDLPVEALYIEMGDSAMIFRVRWWIESYEDTRRMFDRVNTTLQKALDIEGVDIPFPTQTMNLQIDPNTAVNLSQAFNSDTKQTNN